MIIENARLGVVVAIAIVALAACTTEYPLGFSAQSHFTYPDSTVTPIRNVSGSASESTFNGQIQVTGQMKQEAIDSALAGTPNANVLLNYQEDVKITSIWIYFGMLDFLEYSVEGVAATAEVK